MYYCGDETKLLTFATASPPHCDSACATELATAVPPPEALA